MYKVLVLEEQKQNSQIISKILEALKIVNSLFLTLNLSFSVLSLIGV